MHKGNSDEPGSFSSLYIGILAATLCDRCAPLHERRFSSLYIGILAATGISPATMASYICFSSLYIGILAATESPLLLALK